MSAVDDARYTRIIHSRLCCNLYVLITFSRNGFGDIWRIVTSILQFMGKMSFVCRA